MRYACRSLAGALELRRQRKPSGPHRGGIKPGRALRYTKLQIESRTEQREPLRSSVDSAAALHRTPDQRVMPNREAHHQREAAERDAWRRREKRGDDAAAQLCSTPRLPASASAVGRDQPQSESWSAGARHRAWTNHATLRALRSAPFAGFSIATTRRHQGGCQARGGMPLGDVSSVWRFLSFPAEKRLSSTNSLASLRGPTATT